MLEAQVQMGTQSHEPARGLHQADMARALRDTCGKLRRCPPEGLGPITSLKVSPEKASNAPCGEGALSKPNELEITPKPFPPPLHAAAVAGLNIGLMSLDTAQLQAPCRTYWFGSRAHGLSAQFVHLCCDLVGH